MSKPRGFSNLNKNQKIKYDLLLAKEELSEKEQSDLSHLKNKLELHINPPILSVSAEDHLVEMYSRGKYGFRNASTNSLGSVRQLKGFALEKEGIDLISRLENIKFSKEKDLISDDYLIGVCDIINPKNDKILDIKTSWNASNYMKMKKSRCNVSVEVWSQMQGYLHLYKKKEGEICYVLVNTPEHLIEQEYANLFKRYTYGEITREKYDEECYKLNGVFDYNKIPEHKRVTRFNVKYSPLYIEMIKSRVILARDWLNKFERYFMSNKIIQTNLEHYLKSSENDTENNLD
jgi:hypothetical protein